MEIMKIFTNKALLCITFFTFSINGMEEPEAKQQPEEESACLLTLLPYELHREMAIQLSDNTDLYGTIKNCISLASASTNFHTLLSDDFFIKILSEKLAISPGCLALLFGYRTHEKAQQEKNRLLSLAEESGSIQRKCIESSLQTNLVDVLMLFKYKIFLNCFCKSLQGAINYFHYKNPSSAKHASAFIELLILRKTKESRKEFLNHQTDEEDNALILSAQHCLTDVMHVLLKYGADIDLTSLNSIKWSPLFFAAREHDPNTVKLLLDQGADISLRDLFNDNCLISLIRFAIPPQEQYYKILELLIHPLTIDAQNKLGDTPLMLAVIRDQIKTVKELIGRGANVSLTNNMGATALQIAKDMDIPNREIIWMLENNESLERKN